MTHAELLALLLPPSSYDPSAPLLSAELAAEGKTLDQAQVDVLATLDAITPDGDLSMLPEWERVYGLPDPALGPNQSVALRLASVIQRINETGEFSRDSMVWVALALGYSITFTEFHPFQVESPVEQPLYGDDWMFALQINAAEDENPLGTALLESTMRRIAMAHIVLLFNFAGTPHLFMFEEGDGFLLTEDNDYLDMS
ncbi:TPA: DUF2313 domain-containing protein [Burkholderia vietnamiensis]|nr:DUF2313 domain-containing protein [Burkholderia vietnamiensis]